MFSLIKNLFENEEGDRHIVKDFPRSFISADVDFN